MWTGSLMFISARQLEELYRTSGADGQVVVPYSAKLTPLAKDWLKARKVKIGYADVAGPGTPTGAANGPSPTGAIATLPLLWWCDGPCGVGKAALMNASREVALKELVVLDDATRALSAVRALALEVGAGSACGGVLLVKSNAAACVFANRTRSLRAVVGTSLANVEDAVKIVAANVLVLEQDKLVLNVARNLIVRFAKSVRAADAALLRELSDLSKF